MHTDLVELQSNLSNFNDFALWYEQKYNKDVLTSERWEIREALSFYYFSVETTDLIDSIIASIQHNSIIEWKSQSLNIIDEAKIQNILRSLNYNLDAGNTFPTNTTLLKTQLTKVSLLKLIEYKIINRVGHEYQDYKIRFVKLMNFKYLLLAVAGVLYFQDWYGLLLTLLFTYIIWFFVDFIRHEYMEHSYVVPKNTAVKCVSEFVMYMLVPAVYYDRTGNIKTHMEHHQYWKEDKDCFTRHIAEDTLPGLENPKFFDRPIDLNRMPYLIEAKIALMLLVAVLVGVKAVLFVFLIPVLFMGVLHLQHDYWIINYGERDYPWLFPIALNQAWHYSHHKNFKLVPTNWSMMFNGPTWVKYINPQYYFARAFFKLRVNR